MSFQNGIGHEAIIQSIVGNEKVIGGTTTQASNILGPGHIMNHGSLPSWIGEYEGGITDRIKEIADTFTAHNLEMIAAEDVKIQTPYATNLETWMAIEALSKATGYGLSISREISYSRGVWKLRGESWKVDFEQRLVGGVHHLVSIARLITEAP